MRNVLMKMEIVLLLVLKEYFRPLEVDTLLGNSKKARKDLKWKPHNFNKKIS